MTQLVSPTLKQQLRHAAVGATMLGLLALSGATAGAQTTSLPTRLADAEFWNIFTTFSEDGGTFTTENFTSNEAAVALVASDIDARGRTGGAYIGVGAEQNFTYIPALQPAIVFVVDIRRQAAIQQLLFKALFELAPTRADFIEKLFALPPPRTQRSRDATVHDIWHDYLNAAADSNLRNRNLAEVTNHLTVTRKFEMSADDRASLAHVYGAFVRAGPAIHYLTGLAAANVFRSANFASLTMAVDAAGQARSFLASEGHFALVKDMHARNMIIPVVGDFAGDRALRAVGNFLRAFGTTVNAFYVSNVEQYLFRPINRMPAFLANVAALPLDSASVLIRPGAAGSRVLPGPPFTAQSSDSAVRAFIGQQMLPGIVQKPSVALCPALQFLAAYQAGRVTVYADAEGCVR